MELLDEDEIDVVYAERNVLQEEATTVQAETITVDRFRQRFIGTVDRVSGGKNFAEKSNVVLGLEKSGANSTANCNDLINSEQHPKYKAPPPPPRQRRTSSSSTTIKVQCVPSNLAPLLSLDSSDFKVAPVIAGTKKHFVRQI